MYPVNRLSSRGWGEEKAGRKRSEEMVGETTSFSASFFSALSG